MQFDFCPSAKPNRPILTRCPYSDRPAVQYVKMGQEPGMKSSCFRVPAPSSLLPGLVFKPWEVTPSPTPQAPHYQAWPASSWDWDSPGCLSHVLQLLTFPPSSATPPCLDLNGSNFSVPVRFSVPVSESRTFLGSFLGSQNRF